MRIFILFIVLTLFFSQSALAEKLCPADQRIIEVESYSKGVHILSENCENIGTFSLGGLYNDKFEKLTFSYPFPWRGTFISLKVGNKIYSNSNNPENGIFLDQYVEKLPHVRGESIVMSWLLPENILVEQVLEAVDTGTKITIRATNQNNEEFTFGVRMHLDTMLGENDGAPIYIPGDDLKSFESEYFGVDLNFRYWKAYNKADDPFIIATGFLEGENLTYPDGIVVANWKKSMRSDWDYKINSSDSILGDSALILYFGSNPVGPGESLSYSTAYVNGEPVLPVSKGDFGITEILTDRVSAKYCSGDNVSVTVDLLSRKTPHEGGLILEVVNKEGQIIYEKSKATGKVNPDSITSVDYVFTIPPDLSKDSLEVKAVLYVLGDQAVDEKTITVLVDNSLCETDSQLVFEFDYMILVYLIIFLVLIILLVFIARTAHTSYINRGDIEVSKIADGELIQVIIKNDTRREIKDCLLLDSISEGVEVNISTAGVHRKGDQLTWNIGKLIPGESVVLEYKLKKPGLISPALFKWDAGEKESQ